MAAESGDETAPEVSLPRLFAAHQRQLLASLGAIREAVGHAGVKGEASELDWIGMLRKHLPNRYQVSKAIVVDSDGRDSDQIDLVIHDRQYSPLLFNYRKAVYLPAESVYAVFEVKQTLSKANLDYAGSKAASVRRLRRTSVRIRHAGGEFRPKRHAPILAGVLTTDVEWKGDIASRLRSTLEASIPETRLDLGCAAARAGFEATYTNRGVKLATSGSSLSVSFFMIRLLSRLQGVGTVPAIDLDRYLRAALGPKRGDGRTRKEGPKRAADA